MSAQTRYEGIFYRFWNGELDLHGYLDELANTFGTFQVQKHEEDGFISKRRDWFEARDMPYFMNSVNHRTPCSCEILFDIDLPAWMTMEERMQILRMTLRRLKELNIEPLSFYTGKGFHLHWFDDKLIELLSKYSDKSPSFIRDKYVGDIIKEVKTDQMMIRGNNTLQIEGIKHWKRNFVVQPVDKMNFTIPSKKMNFTILNS